MKSKSNRNHNQSYDEYEDDYETDRQNKGKKLSDHRRRPIKNWKKVWSEHNSDYEEVDDFFANVRR